MSRGKAIALVDCDSFYASCEQLADPSLKGKAVCVMSNNDGCIVARSKEAKRLGVKMGMPVFIAKKEYPQAIYLSGRLGFYQDISNRVIEVLRDFSPTIEVYSIDEAFLDLTGLRKLHRKNYLQMAADIRHEVNRQVGIPVSVGVSLSKVLAKLATENAKKGDGYHRIGFRSIDKALKEADIGDIWGIGGNTAALLNKFGIYCAYDLCTQSDRWVSKILGKRGLELKYELIGESVYPVVAHTALPKSIQKTRSFGEFTREAVDIRGALHYHCHRACRKLRQLGLKTQSIGILLKTRDFKTTFAKRVLLKPTDWEFEICEAIDSLFYEIFTPGPLYRACGVILYQLSESREEQLSLFDDPSQRSKRESLAKTWDFLEQKYGYDVVTKGIYTPDPSK